MMTDTAEPAPSASGDNAARDSYSDDMADYKDSMNRWIGVSLITFDAAGIVATLNLYDRLQHPKLVFTLFGVAMLCCFLTAIAYLGGVHAVSFKLDQLGHAGERSETSLPTGSEATAGNVIAAFALYFAPAVILGFAACVLSAVAGFAFAWSLPSPSISDKRRCRVIEHEMMRGQPRRDDLPDLFQALGCRPQLNEPPRRPA